MTVLKHHQDLDRHRTVQVLTCNNLTDHTARNTLAKIRIVQTHTPRPKTNRLTHETIHAGSIQSTIRVTNHEKSRTSIIPANPGSTKVTICPTA